MILWQAHSHILLHENATVTLCHSRTKNLSSYTKEADILVSAIGKPNFITSSMVKKGAIIIDAGTSKVGNKLVGDVDFQGVIEKVDKITLCQEGVGL